MKTANIIYIYIATTIYIANAFCTKMFDFDKNKKLDINSIFFLNYNGLTLRENKIQKKFNNHITTKKITNFFF
ncbi:MAG TPA: hypothetical protein V7791_00205 [Candidatus Azoamicus sp. OHIO1]